MDDSQHQRAIAAFADAIRIAGNQTAVAKICECTPGAISQLVIRGRPLSARFVLKVEAATGISRHDLRPDIYPIDLSPAPASEAAAAASDFRGPSIPDGRTSSFPDANLDHVEVSHTVAGGEAAQSDDDPGCAADTAPIGKAAA